jgi:hypothetical protein
MFYFSDVKKELFFLSFILSIREMNKKFLKELLFNLVLLLSFLAIMEFL